MEPNYIQELGNLAIATRLKQFTELLMRDMVKIYKEQRFKFEPRWFTFVHLLSKEGQLSLTEIARRLNQTHVAANQVANALEKNKLIKVNKDKHDSRKRMITLNKNGYELVKKLEPIWDAVELAVDRLFREASVDFLHDIEKIEIQLFSKTMYERIKETIKQEMLKDLKIISYKPVYKYAFIDLNLAWLEKYFKVEPYDRQMLFNPDEEIIGKGGDILLTELRGEIIGTAALLKVNPKLCELTKMTVSEKFRGMGIGHKLLVSAKTLAQTKGYKKITLLTNPKMEYAVNLYRKFGFVESQEPSLLMKNLKRESIQMELKL